MAANPFGAHPCVGHSGAESTVLIEMAAAQGPADEPEPFGGIVLASRAIPKGSRERENVALQLNLLVLAPQSHEFLTFGTRQAVAPLASITIRLRDPVANRLG
jgi:hypothetical protein